MRRVVPLLLLVVLALGALLLVRSRRAGPGRPEISPAAFRATYLRGIDRLDTALVALAALGPDAAPDSVRAAFRGARAAYKRIEGFVEFGDAFRFTAFDMVEGPFVGIELNGPPTPRENEDDREHPLPPTGFQVIEAAVFPRPAPGAHALARGEVERMRRVLDNLRAEPAETLEADRWALDAARLEVARVATLGLGGFDALLSGDGLPESAEALRGVGDGLAVYRAAMQERDSAGWVELDRALGAAIAELERAGDPDEFDRLGFLVRFLNPLTGALGRLQRSLALPPSRYPGAWSPGAMNIYQTGAISPGWFAPDYAAPPGPKAIALGRALFADPALSVHRRRACVSCHQPARAFADGLARAAVDSGHAAGQDAPPPARNTPTLLNAGLQRFQFADQRSRYLEFQVEEVMRNPVEMGFPVDSAARRLGEDSAMVARFADALGTPRSAALTGRMVAVAVAAYVRSLVALDAPFDRAVRGDTAALTRSEVRGFNLFLGKARCATCHFPPLFGGTVPPGYRESEVEVIGVPARPVGPAGRGAVVDPDPGVMAIDRLPLHRHAFKTPGLRNVALTAPYMHNGVFQTLDEVIDFYDRGGGNGLGMRLPNQTLPEEQLHLADGEKQDLVAFLGALTDTVVAAPRS